MTEAIKHLRWQFGVWILALAASVAICVQPVSATESRVATKVQGGQETAHPPYGFPVLVAGWDGTNVQDLLTDVTGKLLVTSTISGTQTVQGTAADGAAAVGNPVQVGGVDGSGNAQALLTDTSGRQQVVGGAANGASSAGINPVLVCGADGGPNLVTLRMTQPADALVNALNSQCGIAFSHGYNGATWDRTRTANGASNTTGTGLLGVGTLVLDATNTYQVCKQINAADNQQVGVPGVAVMGFGGGTSYTAIHNGSGTTDGNTGTRVLAVENQGFNNVNYDRFRNNTDTSLTTQTGATTTFTSADQTNFNGGHIVVVLDMTVIGTGSVTLEIDNKDVISGKYYSILTGAAVVGNSTNVYSAGPALPATANVSANAILSRTFRIKVTANNANATTYTVGYSINCN